MLKSYRLIICTAITVTFFSCGEKLNPITVKVKNDLDFERREVVSIDVQDLQSFLKLTSKKNIKVKKEGTGDYLSTQWIDYDLDGSYDELLFQASVDSQKTSNYQVVIDSVANVPQSDKVTFSRFVPERTEDYTWENDRVAFRTFGPEAQRRIEQNEYGGTLSSGIDLWLKRVNYSIIDNWYAKNLESEGYYHIDHGEGYDPYHVGISRGTGGTGIWENDTLLVSKNFVSYKTIATGPLRTVFELSYAPWGPNELKETKRITLDLGSNFSKFEIDLDSGKPVENYTLGITLHEKKGEVEINQKEGWFSHWEPIDDTFLGEGIVIDNEIVKEAFVHESSTPDQSQLFVITTPQKNRITYYAGFGWTKSGQVSSVHDWETMLQKQVQIIKNPLQVTLK